jgi:predicted dehydrogenase
MKSVNRRTFVKHSLWGAAALAVPLRARSQILSASETIQVGVVGIGGRGGDHIKGMLGLKDKGVKIVALCDIDQKFLDRNTELFAKRNERVETYLDIRKMLEDKNIDAVTIATPNHWHALAAIWAVQAGKDVYVEKPVSHNVWEGRKIVEAARKYNRIVQTGTQSRSSQAIREAVAWVKAGNLGKINIARGLCYKPRRSIGKVSGPTPIPESVNYDLWCGPAPMGPLMRKNLHYDWHWVWDTGCGDLGNQGIHQMDIARWFLGVNELSPRVLSMGGRLGYDDDGETPNTQIVYHGYAQAPLIFEVRGLPKNKMFQTDKEWNGNMDKYPSEEKDKGGSVAVIIECEGGNVVVPNYSAAIAFDKAGKEVQRWSGATDHYENFIQAVRSRKASDLNADILEGHLSSALCHTGNVSYRLGSARNPGEIRERLQDQKGAGESFDRMKAHLEANGVDVSDKKIVLGEVLQMDPQKETFLDNMEANALLTRHYRRPYVVPQRV